MAKLLARFYILVLVVLIAGEAVADLARDEKVYLSNLFLGLAHYFQLLHMHGVHHSADPCDEGLITILEKLHRGVHLHVDRHGKLKFQLVG